MTETPSKPPPLTPALQGGVVAAGLVLAAFFPGQMSYDSLVQLTEARAGPITDLHPPLMSWLWRVLDRLVAGPAPMLVLQLTVLVVALALVGRWLSTPRRAFLLPLLVLWCPSVFAIAGTIWKDVLFAGMCLLSAGALMQTQWPRGRRAGLALAALLGAASLRHNGIAAVLPLAVWAAAVALPAGRSRFLQLGLGLGLTALIFAGSTGITRALAEAATTNPSQQILFHDLAALTAATGKTHTPEGYLAQHPRCAGQPLADAYALNPNNVAVVVFAPEAPCPPTADPGEHDALRTAWRGAIAEAPGAWARHRWSLWRTLLGAIAGPVYYPFHRGIDPNGLGAEFKPLLPAKLFTGLLDGLKDSLLFRAWAWLAMGLVVAAVGLRRQRPELVALPLSAWSFALAYLPTAPVADFRLVWWCVVANAVAAGLLWGAKSR